MNARTDRHDRPVPARPRPVAFNPDALPALRNMILNGYKILDPEGHDISGVVLDIMGNSR